MRIRRNSWWRLSDTSAAEQILKDNGVSQSVRYGTGPLLVPAEIISPYCGIYLELIMKADRLLSLLEYQRLRRYITNLNCDKEFSRVDRLLKSVASTAFGLAKGLRQRTYAATEKETDTKAAAFPVQTGDTAAVVEINAGNDLGP